MAPTTTVTVQVLVEELERGGVAFGGSATATMTALAILLIGFGILVVRLADPRRRT
ncbi:MAG: hypothetical protein ACRD0M_03000 [Acidimicrobiales bacterium]